MGEVWRATDTKLNRDVAIKVLPAAFAEDAARMARFEREAQVLASLNHPNIAAIYGVEQGAIVMELVDGEDLAGPLPVDTVIDYARQMAAGLDAAHEKGIVHRDLKPANIKLTSDGVVKLLDFGLAKAREESAATAMGAGSMISPTLSPTMTQAMTQAGLILGTAAYMSPEQARGKPVDKRSDIWAYGVILYELLTGRHLYGGGETVTDTLAAVVLKEPDFSALPADTPQRLRRLIERCLKKDAKLRLRDIGEARLMLDEPEIAAPAAAAIAVTKAAPSRLWMPIAGVLALGLAGLAVVHFRQSPPPREMVRFSVQPPEGGSFPSLGNMALSPDGRKLVFSAVVKGMVALWVRPLDSIEARPLAGTENANFPFWSPDSRFVGFTADGRLKKVDTLGGPPQTLCVVGPNAPTTGSWASDGWIYFPNGREGIFRVPQAGGDAVRLTQVGAAETFHVFPQVLPDGRGLLFWLAAGNTEQAAVWFMSTDGKAKKRIAPSVRTFSYVPPLDGGSLGHLLLTRQDTLMAQPVNATSFDLAGDPFPVAEHVGNLRSYAFFTSSANGVLAYRVGVGAGTRQIAWFDRTGKPVGNLGAPGDYVALALARDGSRAAIVQNESVASKLDLWLYDIARDVPSRFTFNDAEQNDPVWSPDGSMLAFSSRRDGLYTLYLKNANGAAQEERLQKAEDGERPCDWSPDGRFLLYTTRTKGGVGGALWTVENPADPAKRKKAPYLDDGHAVSQGQFSPGPAGGPRWVAYTSDESKHGYEIFVQSFPLGAGKFQVSRGGGTQARWRHDGKELFYSSPDGKIMGVDVKLTPMFSAGVPHVVVDTRGSVPNAQITFRYDVSPDGQRFLVNTDQIGAGGTPQPITVVLNWLAGVRK
jgi:Tol biopolymer transport system component